MASSLLPESVVKHEYGIKKGIDPLREMTIYTPWNGMDMGDKRRHYPFFVGLVSDKTGREAKIRFSLGKAPKGMSPDAILALVKRTSFTAIRVIGFADTIAINTAGDSGEMSLFGAFKEGRNVSKAASTCPKAFFFKFGEKLKVEFTHLVVTTLPKPPSTKNLSPLVKKAALSWVIAIHVTMRGGTSSGLRMVSLCVPIGGIAGSGMAPVNVIERLKECTFRCTLGGISGLSLHVCAFGSIPPKVAMWGVGRRMMCCPVHEYPALIFDSTLKDWNLVEARIVVQHQPRGYAPISKPIIGEDDLHREGNNEGESSQA